MDRMGGVAGANARKDSACHAHCDQHVRWSKQKWIKENEVKIYLKLEAVLSFDDAVLVKDGIDQYGIKIGSRSFEPEIQWYERFREGERADGALGIPVEGSESDRFHNGLLAESLLLEEVPESQAESVVRSIHGI